MYLLLTSPHTFQIILTFNIYSTVHFNLKLYGF